MESSKTRFERYAIELVHRSQIKNAPYNPRKISEKARQVLKQNIERVGLLEPIIWNKRTGNIVGGHQRLAALDALEGHSDYSLNVSAVDLDEKTEKEQNVFLNNPNAQGDWDLEKLEQLLSEVTPDFAGFDAADVYQLFGDGLMVEQSEAVQLLSEQVREARTRYESILKKSASKRDSDDFYTVLIFKSNAEREEFSKALGLEDNRWVDGRAVMARINPANN